MCIVNVRIPCASKCAWENSRGSYQEPFSTKAFKDTQAGWWLLEIGRGGKAAQMLPVTSGKLNKVDLGLKMSTYLPITSFVQPFQQFSASLQSILSFESVSASGLVAA